MKLRVGTRGSALARIQTGRVSTLLRREGLEVEEIAIETEGDRDRTSAFADIGAAGIFVRELERALLEERIDVAVHSYKDLPSQHPEALTVTAIPERLDPADHLLVRRGSLSSEHGRIPLDRGARVGTSSARRSALLLREREDLDIRPLRGNVDTRVRRLVEGRYDAIVLAGAGLQRMRAGGALGTPEEQGLRETRLSPKWFVPAPAQGAIALQIRAADSEIAAALDPLHDADAAHCVLAERRLLARVEGDCELPFGAWCRGDVKGGLRLSFALGSADEMKVDAIEGEEPRTLADRAWDRLLAAGLLER